MKFEDLTIEKVLLIGTAVCGAIAWAWMQYRTWRKDKAAEADSITERELAYSSKLETRNSQLMLENASLQKTVIELRLQQVTVGVAPVEVLKSVIEACPKLMWAKRRDPDGSWVIVQVSYSFAAMYLGGPPKSYQGRKLEEFFDQSLVDGFNKLDELCLRTQAPVAINEFIYGSPTNVRGKISGYKFSVKILDGHDYVVGIADHVPDPTS